MLEQIKGIKVQKIQKAEQPWLLGSKGSKVLNGSKVSFGSIS